MGAAEQREALRQFFLDVGAVAELAALADVTDVVREGAVGAEELVRHLEIVAKQGVPGDQPMVAVIHGDALRHVFQRRTQQRHLALGADAGLGRWLGGGLFLRHRGLFGGGRFRSGPSRPLAPLVAGAGGALALFHRDVRDQMPSAARPSARPLWMLSMGVNPLMSSTSRTWSCKPHSAK